MRLLQRSIVRCTIIPEMNEVKQRSTDTAKMSALIVAAGSDRFSYVSAAL
jgi:hypothetical protein